MFKGKALFGKGIKLLLKQRGFFYLPPAAGIKLSTIIKETKWELVGSAKRHKTEHNEFVTNLEVQQFSEQ